MLIFFRFIILLLVILYSIPGLAQDTHYWNLQYGTRSTLLGGAVIGSVTDMAPTLFAGSFTFDWLDDQTLSYSIHTRQRMNFGVEGRR